MTDSPDATQPTHDRTPEHPTDVPAGVKAMGALNPNSLMHRMGIEIVEASAQRLVATMPVEGNTQPYGLLHGGASVALAETLGSAAGNCCLDIERSVAVGLRNIDRVCR